MSTLFNNVIVCIFYFRDKYKLLDLHGNFDKY